MAPTVWLSPGKLVIYGAALDAEEHAHHAIQVVWPAGECTLEVNGERLAGLVVVAANVPHRLTMAAGWVILVEPQSDLGEALSRQLQHRTFLAVPESSTCHLQRAKPDVSCDPDACLGPLWEHLGVSGAGAKQTHQDGRIKRLIRQLDACFEGPCIKPASWRAHQVASDLALSEGRFLHLFRDEMGIAWRPYLLWRRLLCAVNALASGESATVAAHRSGFSDSAHLSRTFRQSFGVSIRQARQLFV